MQCQTQKCLTYRKNSKKSQRSKALWSREGIQVVKSKKNVKKDPRESLKHKMIVLSTKDGLDKWNQKA